MRGGAFRVTLAGEGDVDYRLQSRAGSITNKRSSRHGHRPAPALTLLGVIRVSRVDTKSIPIDFPGKYHDQGKN